MNVKDFIDVFISSVWILCIYIFSEISYIQIALYLAFAIYILCKQRHTFSSPYGVFVLIYSMYSISYPFHVFINGYTYDNFVSTSLFLHSLGLYGYYLSSMFLKGSRSRVNLKEIRSSIITVYSKRLYIYLAFFFLISLVFIYQVGSSSASNKQELAGTSGGVAYYGVLFYIIVSLYVVLNQYIRKNRTAYVFLLFNFLFLSAIYLVSGERDVVFKFIFFMMIFFFDFKLKFKKKYYIYIVLSLLVFLPITQLYKAIFLDPNATREFILEPSTLFVGEFISSGRNVTKLLEYNHQFLIGERLVYDILRFLRVSTFDNVEVISTGMWYNTIVLPSLGVNANSGWGFSWIGFLYVSFGFLGPFFGMFLSGVILNYLYFIRGKSIHCYIFYGLSLSIFLYIQRADLANLMGQEIKFTLFPILTIYLLNKINLTRRNYETRY